MVYLADKCCGATMKLRLPFVFLFLKAYSNIMHVSLNRKVDERVIFQSETERHPLSVSGGSLQNKNYCFFVANTPPEMVILTAGLMNISSNETVVKIGLTITELT